jgi:hypothetical protein
MPARKSSTFNRASVRHFIASRPLIKYDFADSNTSRMIGATEVQVRIVFAGLWWLIVFSYPQNWSVDVDKIRRYPIESKHLSFTRQFSMGREGSPSQLVDHKWKSRALCWRTDFRGKLCLSGIPRNVHSYAMRGSHSIQNRPDSSSDSLSIRPSIDDYHKG